ncbi:MAG: MarR family transcriptional regulator [Variibacter sp.]|nr:MarR family transcriptional regulator [Variibacter sp.]
MQSRRGREEVESAAADAPLATLRLEEFLPYRLNVLAVLVSQALARLYGDRYGISVPEWRVLVTLGQFGVMTGKAIGAHSHMHKAKVSRAVALLEQRAFVSRRANAADHRQALLSLTAAGQAIYQEFAPVAHAFSQRLLECLSPADRAALDRAIGQLTERSAAMVAEIPPKPSRQARRTKPPAGPDGRPRAP